MALPHAGVSPSFFGRKIEHTFKVGTSERPRDADTNVIRAIAVQASKQFSSKRSRIGGETNLHNKDDHDGLASLFDDDISEETERHEHRLLKKAELGRHQGVGPPPPPVRRNKQSKAAPARIKARPPLSKEGQEGRLLEKSAARQAKFAGVQEAGHGGMRAGVAPKGGVQASAPEHLEEEEASNWTAMPSPDRSMAKLNRREWEDLALKRLRQQRLRKMELAKESAVKEEVRQVAALQAKEKKAAAGKNLGREIELAQQASLPVRSKVTVRRITGSTAELATPSMEPSATVEERSDWSDASEAEDLEASESTFLGSHRELFDDLGLNAKERMVAAYLLSLGFATDDFRRLADKRLQAFLTNLHAAKARVAYLRSLGVQAAALPKVLVRHPQLLEYSIERTMQPRVEYLMSLGLARSQLGRIITLAPTLLQHSVEDGLKPRVRFLQEVVGIADSDVPLVVQRSPQILTQSIENSLQPKLQFLQSLGVDFEGLARMVTRHPQLLHYSVQDSMQPRVEFLRSIGMSGPDIVRTIVRLSQILSLSVESNLAPKYEYLTTHLGGDANTILRFPAFFSLSLEQRIKPRHQFLEKTQRMREGPFPMKLLTYTDEAFCRVVQCSVQEFEAFKQDLLLNSLAQKFGNVTLGSKKKKKSGQA